MPLTVVPSALAAIKFVRLATVEPSADTETTVFSAVNDTTVIIDKIFITNTGNADDMVFQ